MLHMATLKAGSWAGLTQGYNPQVCTLAFRALYISVHVVGKDILTVQPYHVKMANFEFVVMMYALFFTSSVPNTSAEPDTT